MKIRKIPRGTFWVGGLAAVALAVPLLTVGISAVLRWLAWGRTLPALDTIFMMSLIFAGFPAFLSGGGVARLVAHRLAEQPASGLSRALVRAVLAMGIAGAGLGLLAIVPLGVLPEKPRTWWPVAVVGVGTGIVCGLAIAVLAGMRQRRRSQTQAATGQATA